jgi:PAS domain S-box-containing protein
VRRLSSMTAGLALGISLAVAAACAIGAYLYSQRHVRTLLDLTESAALSQAELIRAALEHGMVEEDRTLIRRMVRSFSDHPEVTGVMLLDRRGVVQYSSGPAPSGEELQLSSPTCQACHRLPAALRASSRVVDAQGAQILRTVVPVPNRTACHACHDPAHAINGVVIVDMDAERIRAAATGDLRWLVGWTGLLALGLVAAVAVVVRLAVLRRLQRFETTARQIAEGRLDRRVPTEGNDTIAWLAREFNVMADSVTGLLGQVRSERERLERVINSIDDGIVVLDAQRTVLAANDAFLERAGSTRGRMLGCSCSDREGLCGVSDCPSTACLRTGKPQVRVCERRRADGVIAWEEVHASPITDESGTPIQVVEVWRDITERRAAEARMAESHRLASLGLLASGFSHELNTPLGTVLACVEGIGRELRRDGTDLTRIADQAGTARDQVLRCRGITQHFLRLSRGHAEPGEIVDVRRALEAVVRLIQPTARESGIAIDVLPPPGDVPPVRAAEADLQQAFMNLLLNAVQACAPGGTVTVTVEPGPPVRVAIRDTGCGIAEPDQARIFEPFFSLRNGGTGLGLFLTLGFVRRWGGEIVLRSAPHAGSTFTVILPIRPEHARAVVA